MNKHIWLNIDGFGLLDTITAVGVCAIAFAGVAAVSVHLVEQTRLDTTAWTLLNQLRFVQTLASTSQTYGAVWLDKFDTRYRLTYGIRPLASYSFAPGIQYVDGYLQLNDARIFYDDLGDAQAAGKVRLTDGRDERDINLYMGTGLQSAGWLTK